MRIDLDDPRMEGWTRDGGTRALVPPDGEEPDRAVLGAGGVLTDGNGHWYDAHDLPEGMSWDGESMCPEVADGYVLGPDGRVWDGASLESEERLREAYGDEWSYDGDVGLLSPDGIVSLRAPEARK